MKTKTAILALLLFSCAAFAAESAQPKAEEKEFHDPFATEATQPMAAEKAFHDPFATEENGAQPKISDPLERVNRSVFHFNDRVYRWMLRPVSRAYRTVTPKPARESLDRLFTNVKFPIRLVNNLLEGRFKGAALRPPVSW